MQARTNNRRRLRTAPRRRGAILSMELVFVLPIVLGLLFAIIEFGMLWSAQQLAKEASAAGCRVATLPGADELAVRHAVEQVLRKPHYVSSYQLRVFGGARTGDEVGVAVRLPMTAAAPDLLGILGFRLGGRNLTAETVMRKE